MGKNNGNRIMAKLNFDQKQLASGLGWFSIGLGLAGIFAPRSLGRLAGVRRSSGLLRLIGVRELASGIGILTQPRPSQWIQARVAGDLMDLALLGAAMVSENSDRSKVALATAAVAGVTALDIRCCQDLDRNPD